MPNDATVQRREVAALLDAELRERRDELDVVHTRALSAFYE